MVAPEDATIGQQGDPAMPCPRTYSFDNSYAIASPTKTTLSLTGGTTIRGEIYDMIIGFSGTPADNSFQIYVQRTTAAGTGTTLAGQALEPADPAAITTCLKSLSAEPTYTAAAIVFHLGLNQRASHRWIADPRAPLKIPATSNNGLGLYGVNASATPNMETQVYLAE
jgi:hypothetical protein